MESSNYNHPYVTVRPRTEHEALPMPLLLLADPDPAAIDRYASLCRWWFANNKTEIIGVCGALQRSAGAWEIMNMAVLPMYEGQGIGSSLMKAVLASLDDDDATEITVCTGNSSLGALAFYQKHGFRIEAIEPDYFVQHYDEPIIEHGIHCRDRIILCRRHMIRAPKRPIVLSHFQASVSVRIAQIRDAGPLIRMKRRLDEQTTFMLLEPGERMMGESEQRDMIRYALRSANSNIFLAEHEGQIIGYLEAMGGKVTRNRHSVYIVVGVLQQYANRGIGRRLFQTMLHWAEDRSIHRLELTVQSTNQRGIHLYRSLGFRIEGVQKEALIVDGQYVDLIQMSLLLTSR
ncbi:GNAT family N-acetyltransferase [Paenibacillus campi]|uniref:GNAT family N-acetyltransferase n=1 Tax=Paenibacillus campi TaxID=3106031 RepID=UPI002AFEC985|nr:GNAT family N-acetyltransferase [Paenibacillus sp. SGZ-1014]